jgi:hypothetical protein
MSNLALANLNAGYFSECISWCNKVLDVNFEPNKKIIHRKAKANKNLKNWEEAKKDVIFGLRNCGEDKESINEFKKLREEIEKE